MARNGSGVFAVLNPILVGAVRSSAAVNENFEDMGDEITNSLPIDGQAGMSGQFKLTDGSSMEPGFSFDNDLNTGFRRSAPDVMRWVAGGQDRFYIDTDGKAWLLGNGDAAGNITVTGSVACGLDLGAIEVLSGTGLLRRTGTNEWALDDGTCNIVYVKDGSGTTLPSGVVGDLQIPFACTITGVFLFGDQTGSCVLDIWKDTYANFPPTVADTICSASKPTISSGTKYTDTSLSGWTTSIAAGDCLRFNLDSVSGFTRLEIHLRVKRFA